MFTGEDVKEMCKMPKDIGPCKALFRRFWYDAKNGQCEEFVYGGCRGNGNNFKSQGDCESVCKGGKYFVKHWKNTYYLLDTLKRGMCNCR